MASIILSGGERIFNLQPALLYLVPTCSVSVFLLACVRGQLYDWFNFSEALPEPNETDSNTAAVGATKVIKAE